MLRVLQLKLGYKPALSCTGSTDPCSRPESDSVSPAMMRASFDAEYVGRARLLQHVLSCALAAGLKWPCPVVQTDTLVLRLGLHTGSSWLRPGAPLAET